MAKICPPSLIHPSQLPSARNSFSSNGEISLMLMITLQLFSIFRKRSYIVCQENKNHLLKICVPHNTGASLNSSCLSISGASGISPPHLASQLLGAEALGLNREICGVVRGVYVRVWGEKVVSCTFTLSSPPPSSPAPPYPSLDMSIVQTRSEEQQGQDLPLLAQPDKGISQAEV